MQSTALKKTKSVKTADTNTTAPNGITLAHNTYDIGAKKSPHKNRSIVLPSPLRFDRMEQRAEIQRNSVMTDPSSRRRTDIISVTPRLSDSASAMRLANRGSVNKPAPSPRKSTYDIIYSPLPAGANKTIVGGATRTTPVSGNGGAAGSAAAADTTPLTKEEFEASVATDYMQVKQADWEKIPPNSYIKWVDINGNYRRGSYMTTFWTAKATGRRYMRCQNIIGTRLKILKRTIPNFKLGSFSIPLDTIAAIYKKIDDRCILEMSIANERIAKLESDIARLTTIVGVLAGKL